ncbi:MAG: NTP transferase domain-containing protein [Bacteroidaceae bacterium]|nr:NTP transferase domain-containing protein [Bacteroidaceae bacterium]
MKQVLILAAGMGTRLKPLTDRMPKAMVPVAGKPLLWHIVMKMKAAGFERIVVNVHHFAQQIVDYLKENDNFGLDIRISDETATLLDTGGAIKHALPLFDTDSPILIHNVDILSNVDVETFYDKAEEADAQLLVGERKTSRYLLFDDQLHLCGWTNDDKGIVRCVPSERDVSQLRRLAFTGIHTIHPRLTRELALMPDKFGVFDFYMRFCQNHPIAGCFKPDLRMLDVGKLDTLEHAEQFLTSAK